MLCFTETVDLTISGDEEVARPHHPQVLPLFDSDGEEVIPEGAGATVALGQLTASEVQQLESTGRVKVAFTQKPMIEQMVELAQKADASAVYHKFCWIPTDEELSQAMSKMPKKFKKVHQDVSTQKNWFAEPNLFSEPNFFWNQNFIVNYFIVIHVLLSIHRKCLLMRNLIVITLIPLG